MDAVSKAEGGALRQEGGGVEEAFPGRGGEYLKILSVPCPVGNSGTVSVFFCFVCCCFYDLSMTLRQWGPVNLPPGFSPHCVSVMYWSPTLIS